MVQAVIPGSKELNFIPCMHRVIKNNYAYRERSVSAALRDPWDQQQKQTAEHSGNMTAWEYKAQVEPVKENCRLLCF